MFALDLCKIFDINEHKFLRRSIWYQGILFVGIHNCVFQIFQIVATMALQKDYLLISIAWNLNFFFLYQCSFMCLLLLCLDHFYGYNFHLFDDLWWMCPIHSLPQLINLILLVLVSLDCYMHVTLNMLQAKLCITSCMLLKKPAYYFMCFWPNLWVERCS